MFGPRGGQVSNIKGRGSEKKQNKAGGPRCGSKKRRGKGFKIGGANDAHLP